MGVFMHTDFISNYTNTRNFLPLKVVCRGSETQLQVGENLYYYINSALRVEHVEYTSFNSCICFYHFSDIIYFEKNITKNPPKTVAERHAKNKSTRLYFSQIGCFNYFQKPASDEFWRWCSRFRVIRFLLSERERRRVRLNSYMLTYIDWITSRERMSIISLEGFSQMAGVYLFLIFTKGAASIKRIIRYTHLTNCLCHVCVILYHRFISIYYLFLIPRYITLEAVNYFLKTLETKGFFQFEIIINISVSSFRFIWIPMLGVYGH